MYIDLIIFLLLVIVVVAFFRSFTSFVYIVVFIDMLYRLLHFIADNVNVPELESLINKYVPSDVIGLVSNYIGTSGILHTILIWIMFVIYCIFLSYIFKTLVKRTI